ncbi:MAG: PIF1 family DEAD/DEAH box helicase [Candidatus Falkowbacteria bacterium]|nr:PIF1 family DEAD/DEAH box helicase [Candidatus Falkowbacteria bacterium]
MTQKQAFEILKQGHNIYLTGAAGSGKTFLLNQYIDWLKKKQINVAITASTGVAATHLNGITIHSWAGIGIKDKFSDLELKQLLKKSYLKKRFVNTRVLVIDEVSMLHSFRLDLVDRVCRVFCKNNLPFGGIQVVLCGDFFQLPPVSSGNESSEFIYKSDAWQKMNIKICYLEHQFRQTDNQFNQLLNEIRSNSISAGSKALLMSRHNKDLDISLTPTRLYTHNIDVDVINGTELEKLAGPSKTYDMTGHGQEILVNILRQNCLAPTRLVLKKNAIVMFIKNNYTEGYVNGTLGKIIDFNELKYPIVQTLAGNTIIASPVEWNIEEEGATKASIKQIPLRLAWAITVHKSQGMSLDAAVIDLSKTFLAGMGYVALSRVRSLAGIKLLGINDMAFKVHEDAIKIDAELMRMSKLL